MNNTTSRLLAFVTFGFLISGCPETFSGDGTTGDDVCGDCQAERCSDYRSLCDADPDCSRCMDTPLSVECVSYEPFRKLAACSCNQCSASCDTLCPAGADACQACATSGCDGVVAACISDSVCVSCIDDPFGVDCDSSAPFGEYLECACTSCGQECLWECPDAYGTCAACMLNSCNEAVSACLDDQACNYCFENPLADGCAENELNQAVNVCGCALCTETCGVLFQCGG